MNAKIKQIREQIIIDNDLCDLIPHQEGESYEGTILSDGIYKKKVPIDLSEDDINKLISYKMLEYTKSVEEKVKTMTSIMIFWVLLTIIQLIVGIRVLR